MLCIFSIFFINIIVLNFTKFYHLKSPIVLILNNSDLPNSQKIKKFFGGKNGIKIFEKDFDYEKVLSTTPCIVLDINESNKTRGIYVNCSRKILDKIKSILFNLSDIPFIGKLQANKNKKLELQLNKIGTPYCYLEFPIVGFDKKTILKTELKILKRIVENFK